MDWVGKLPPAKDWCAESVTYQGEFVCYEGATWQASKDTAQKPGGADWACVARAGRDAITPKVRGTFSINETYKQLDIVVFRWRRVDCQLRQSSFDDPWRWLGANV